MPWWNCVNVLTAHSTSPTDIAWCIEQSYSRFICGDLAPECWNMGWLWWRWRCRWGWWLNKGWKVVGWYVQGTELFGKECIVEEGLDVGCLYQYRQEMRVFLLSSLSIWSACYKSITHQWSLPEQHQQERVALKYRVCLCPHHQTPWKQVGWVCLGPSHHSHQQEELAEDKNLHPLQCWWA